MPKIFEYLGIVIYFYSNEHEPIHVHAQKGEFESKAEFYLMEGEIEEILEKSSHPSITKYLNPVLFKQLDIVHGNLNWNDYDLIFPVADLYDGRMR